MPVSGPCSRSALNLADHSKTGFSSPVCAGAVLIRLLFFTSLLFHLPKPVLGAMIILAVLRQVAGVMERTGLNRIIGEENVFATQKEGIDVLRMRADSLPISKNCEKRNAARGAMPPLDRGRRTISSRTV